MKKVKNFYNNFTALVWKEEKWYVAKTLEIEVASQGVNKRDALKNLKEAIELYFENEPKVNIPKFEDISLKKFKLISA